MVGLAKLFPRCRQLKKIKCRKFTWKSCRNDKKSAENFVSENQKFVVQNQQYIYSILVYFRTQNYPNIEEDEQKTRT
jgi:hypothetical protein